MRAVVVIVAILGFYGLFYRHVVAHWGRAVKWAVRALRLDARHPVREAESVGKLAAAGFAQLLLAVLLAWIVGLPKSDLLGSPFEPGLLVIGVVLGAAELAVASLLCTIVVEVAVARAPDSEEAVRRWAGRGRAGWMSYFLLTARAAPSWLAFSIVSLYVCVEELVFRGILITALAGWGAAAAVCCSSALFVSVQAFGMPNKGAALFPMVGATVVGVVHGLLFWLVPAVLPLAVAHVALFAAALSLSAARAAPLTR